MSGVVFKKCCFKLFYLYFKTLCFVLYLTKKILKEKNPIQKFYLVAVKDFHMKYDEHWMFQVSAWGGYVFIINLIPLHVFALLVMGRYSSRLFTSYTTFYILGLLFSMQIPFVGFQPIRTSEHMAASGKGGYLLILSIFWVEATHLMTVEVVRVIQK